MPGIGPRRDPETEPAAGMDGEELAAAARLAHEFYADGQKSVTQGGYPAGYDLGHDVGYGARNDAGRSFAVGVLEGHAAGLEARREMAAKAKDAPAPEPAPQPELEAG